jgi:hypothetical protein
MITENDRFSEQKLKVKTYFKPLDNAQTESIVAKHSQVHATRQGQL